MLLCVASCLVSSRVVVSVVAPTKARGHRPELKSGARRLPSLKQNSQTLLLTFLLYSIVVRSMPQARVTRWGKVWQRARGVKPIVLITASGFSVARAFGMSSSKVCLVMGVLSKCHCVPHLARAHRQIGPRRPIQSVPKYLSHPALVNYYLE